MRFPFSQVMASLVAAVQRAPPSEASGRTSALLLAGDFNIRESEAAQCCTDFALKDASYDGFSWNPRANAYYAAKPGERRKCHRFDRLLFRGAASACAFLVGQCKQFSDGSSFYLSDHFGVLALVDVHQSHLGRAGAVAARERNKALAQLRNETALAESHLVRERARYSHEDAALV